jgi:predicted nucleic acid-binding protein
MGKKKSKTGAFVLDCSVALAWCFHDEASPYADAVLARFPNVHAIVPGIWPLEVANVLLVGERRKRCTPTDTAHWLGSLSALPIAVDDEAPTHVWNQILNLARTFSLSAYDATYLELALRRSIPLATLDDKLKAAVVAAGIAEYTP